MNHKLWLVRRVVLGGSGLTFGVIALAAIAAPHAVAARYRNRLDSIGAMNEFRAIFTGFWLSLALTMITAARKPKLVLLGDLCGAMLALQALGRALSFALDGIPDVSFLGAFAGELAAGITVLAVRPQPSMITGAKTSTAPPSDSPPA